MVRRSVNRDCRQEERNSEEKFQQLELRSLSPVAALSQFGYDLRRKFNEGEIRVNPMNIWVVDIVDIGGTSPEERDSQSRERREERNRQATERREERDRQSRERREERHRRREAESSRRCKNVGIGILYTVLVFALVTIISRVIAHFRP